MTIADLIKELIETSKERLKTPISGAFLWSFLIYNWRPISVLFFSEAPIEDRIIVINHVYCKAHAIYGPLGLAVFYVVGVPLIMWAFDWPIVYTKKIRRAKSKEDKEGILQSKIDISAKVNELKDAESGNKEKQDFLDEIESLKKQIEGHKESIKQISETNKENIEELNTSLKIANESLNQMRSNTEKANKIRSTDIKKFKNLHNIISGDTINLDEELANAVISAGDALSFEEYQILKAVKADINAYMNFDNSKNSEELLSLLSNNKILNYRKSKSGFEAELTEIGVILADIIQSS